MCESGRRLPHVYRENTMVSNASNPTATTTRKTGGFMKAAARDDIQAALRQSCASEAAATDEDITEALSLEQPILLP